MNVINDWQLTIFLILCLTHVDISMMIATGLQNIETFMIVDINIVLIECNIHIWLAKQIDINYAV